MSSLSATPFSPSSSVPQQEAWQPCSPSLSPRAFANFASDAMLTSTTLMERRGRATPRLQICAFQAGGAGAAPSTLPSRSPLSKPATSYDVLEIPPTATDRDIRAAYRRLAGQYHPDRAPPAEKEASTTKFLQIHAAYSLLSDPLRRAQYDLQLSLTAFQSNGYKSRLPRSARAYPGSSNYCSPRSAFSTGRGRSWETDQCWC